MAEEDVLHATVRWLPELGSEGPDDGSAGGEGVMTLPVFPLGGVCYLPFSSHVLNIFEPRYRSMYNDILMNGSRRFIVTMVDPASGRLAETGVIFYLDDLKEVSEQTGDAVKYVCSHSVIGRVEIERVLNPMAWFTRQTYIKARCRVLSEPSIVAAGATEAAEEAAPSAVEAEVRTAMSRVIELQAELNEAPRFTSAMKTALNVSRSDEDQAVWKMIGFWHALQERRLMLVQNRMQEDISRRVVDHFKSSGKPVQGQVRLDDLPADVRADLSRIQEGYRSQLEELAEAPYGEPFQLLLQARGHDERLALFLEMIQRESDRLGRRASLKKLFEMS
ncbi:hypothetical protein T492DRAFT_590057 [Pavlovales sp. CCMP2436]|nr:hypothetical protein T492DRAFT_590057 [Pavlovales sp. CCMP2436]